MESNKEIIEYDGRVLGSYSPSIKSLFVNASIYDVEYDNNIKNKRVYFHEIYHNWQSIFTPFGQLRWYEGQACIEEVVNIWGKMAKKDKLFRKIPIANMLQEDRKETIAIAAIINMACIKDEIIRIMQYGLEEDELGIFSNGKPDYISPVIIYDEQEYKLNGIDIIESFDKYQEALYGEFVNDENFKDILNPDILDQTYYVPFLYYLNEIGDSLMFPVACEIALMSFEVPDIDNETNWKENSPAWRFVNVVQLIKNDSNIPQINVKNLHESYLKTVEYIINKLKYKNYQETYREMYREDVGTWINPFINEMKIAIDFKEKFPGVLAYPFMCNGECVEKLYKFEPHYLRYTDVSMMLEKRDSELYSKIGANEGKWRSMLNMQLHNAALAFQIRGIKSSRLVYYDEFQCGCSYFGIRGCPFYPDVCNGYLVLSEELEFSVDSIEEIKNKTKKIMEIRRDDNIDEYERYKSKLDWSKIDSCPLDIILKVQYGFGILDINIDFKKSTSLKEILRSINDEIG